MKFVFLDIDGVLNAESDILWPDGSSKKTGPRCRSRSGYSYTGIAQRRVARLKKIIEATGAKIVLTSSWKAYYLLYMKGEDDDHIGKYLVNALARKRLWVFDTTSRFEMSGSIKRGRAVVAYLKDWTRRHPDDPIEGFAILDDEEFDYDKVWLDDWLVKTEYYSRDEATAGLTDADIPKAISLIESETLRGKIKYVLEKNENIN